MLKGLFKKGTSLQNPKYIFFPVPIELKCHLDCLLLSFGDIGLGDVCILLNIMELDGTLLAALQVTRNTF